MEKTRKKYNEDFKRDAVNLLLSSGKPMTAVAAEIGIELYNLGRWKNEFLMDQKEQKNESETPGERMKRLEQNVVRLEKENAQLRQERDIIKKAMGIVSKQ